MITYNILKDDNKNEIIQKIDESGKEYLIPKDPANSDYQRYLRWLENPNEVEHLTEIPTANQLEEQANDQSL